MMTMSTNEEYVMSGKTMHLARYERGFAGAVSCPLCALAKPGSPP